MADDLTCAVCAESVADAGLLSECISCGKFFHLNPRADVEGIDCGDVWTGGPEAPALQFHCRPCIDRAQGAEGAAVAAEAPAATPGMPPLPPGAPPEVLAAMAGWAAPDDASPETAPTVGDRAAEAPPPLPPRARRRRRFRRVDRD